MHAVPSKPHRVVAFLADGWVFGTLLGRVMFFSVLAHLGLGWRPGGLLIAAVIALVAGILYYTRYSDRVSFLTPGELLAGRRFSGGEKHWTNPFGCNRWPLFFALLCNLAYAQGLSSGPADPYGALQSFWEHTFICLVLIGASVAIGAGWRRFVYALLFVYLLPLMYGSATGALGGLESLGVVLAVINCIALLILEYRVRAGARSQRDLNGGP